MTQRRWRAGICVIAPLAAMIAIPALADPTGEVPAAGVIANSTMGLVGCVSPPDDAGLVKYYCFAVTQAVSQTSGSFSVEARSYTVPSIGLPTLVAADSAMATSSEFAVEPDGSFSLHVELPHVGTVAIDGAGGYHDYFHHHAAYPLTWAVSSATQSITPYAPTLGPQHLTTSSVGGEAAPFGYLSVWDGPTTGAWAMDAYLG